MSDGRYGKRRHEDSGSYGDRKRPPTQEGLGKVIAKHYNELEEKGVSARQQSRILHLRNCNNWIKSTLLNDAFNRCRERSGNSLSILDLCCGKGGDIQKYLKSSVPVRHVIFADIAQLSVQQCEERYNFEARKQHRGIFSAEFLAVDCTKERINKKYANPQIAVDIVSCQFGFHYSFESLMQVEQMLQNVSDNLKFGGYFVGTIPNSDRIVQKYRESGMKEFGNSVYKIRFECAEPTPLFGAKYYFQLDDVVNCPEFLVHFPCFEELAAKYNLKLEFKYNFDEYFYMKQKEGEFLLNKMQVLEMYPPYDQSTIDREEYSYAQSFLDEHHNIRSVGTISKSEWEAVSLYSVFGFRKVQNVQSR